MSTAVSEIRQHAEERLRELQPLLAEAEQLQQILAMLDAAQPTRVQRLTAPGEAISRSTSVPTSIDGRAPQGANKRRILAIVLDRPGITAAEVARMTGLKRTVVASTMSRLKRTGELVGHGDGASVPADRVDATRAVLAA